MKTAVIIPTYNAGKYLKSLLPALKSQTLAPDELLVVDSGSTDGTVEEFARFEARIHKIDPMLFNHGGTRRLATKIVKADVYVFLTQDAIPAAPEAIERLVQGLTAEEDIGSAYGRQLPHKDARPFGAFAREFNYGSESRTKRMSDSTELGLKACHTSDSFAAYRADALMDVGGFPERVIGTEDTYVAARMLLAGWALRYEASACVRHSHDYTTMQELRRYFDVGVFYGSRERWILETFGNAEKEGLRLVRSELQHLWRMGNKHLIPVAITRSACKHIGYRLGSLESHLPRWFKQRISMNSTFWKQGG